MSTPKAKIGLWTATFMVIANMVGTGVFTSLGFQVVDIKSGFPIEMLWILGGIAALCGALTYGELGTALPRSGGEYHLLSRIVHPMVGFLSGWVSATVGFAAPTALAAIAFATYLAAVVPSIPVVHTAALVVLLFTGLHCWSIVWGSRFNNVLTSLKVILLLLIIIAAFRVPAAQDVTFLPRPGDFGLLLTPAFAVSLVYVAFAYTGWNAAIYIVGEMEDPAPGPSARAFHGNRGGAGPLRSRQLRVSAHRTLRGARGADRSRLPLRYAHFRRDGRRHHGGRNRGHPHLDREA